ncbi:3'(2'),5'-bisphosphate nucleotidase CysQ [Phytoactinopolyspora alkaliphila]|uniref:3'(2'),5'-bisphosphate nucleotidase CysQ n=1 Tax=Phytoactinopolyspora alkaliphila TaxID=1783498 RepID=UPI0031B5C640
MTETDAALATRLAHEAGALLLDVRRRDGGHLDAASLRAAGDRSAQEFLAAALASARPADAVLSEEAADDLARLEAERVWIIDPLDGTKEYAEGRSDWAVHVALWERGELAAGAVALPGRAVTLSTDPAPEVPSTRRGSDEQPWRIAVSRSRAPAVAENVARVLPAELVPMGSAGYKVASVVLGEADGYVHAGGQYQWDSAAPVAVARAAGLHASRLDGSPLRYNDANPYLPDLLVARPELADALLAASSGSATDPAPAVRSHT